jgi:microcompartment protein CcmL/EutN
MAHDALGLIETTNLAAAMEASTAASHAATVSVSSVTLIDALFVVVKVEGEITAVRAAIEAGAHAAQQTGSLICARIIPQRADAASMSLSPKKRSIPHTPVKRSAVPKPRKAAVEISAPRATAKPPSESSASEALPTMSMAELETLPVTKLRQYARALPGLPIQGRQISMANKQQLLDAIRKMS